MSDILPLEMPQRMAETADRQPAALDEQSDEELIAAVVRRDPRALESLIRRHGPWAARFAERLSGSSPLAEEVVQIAFVRLWDRAERWEGRARFRTWFYRVLHNLTIDQLRARRHAFEELDDSLADPVAPLDEALDRARRDARVRAALAHLPERQRAAIVLSHFEECSQAEASRILGITEGALESLLSRGRTALRRHLATERD